MVKFTSFKLFCAYNTFGLTFKRNPRVFDEKEDFRSDFKEQYRTSEAPKNQRKQDEGLHDHAL